jgi:hypothetical protein
MKKARTTENSLPRILIVSAIDILLCSFACGVMLFLIFQPTLRTDRQALLANAVQANESLGSGEGAPALLIVHNSGSSPILPPTNSRRLILSVAPIPRKSSLLFLHPVFVVMSLPARGHFMVTGEWRKADKANINGEAQAVGSHKFEHVEPHRNSWIAEPLTLTRMDPGCAHFSDPPTWCALACLPWGSSRWTHSNVAVGWPSVAG